MAERLGMPPRDFQAIEGGKRAITVRTAVMIAQVLETPVQSLFERPMSRAPPKPGRPRALPRTSTRPRSGGVTPKRRSD
jgi:DNA-binding XRE family transcriptional regulator